MTKKQLKQQKAQERNQEGKRLQENWDAVKNGVTKKQLMTKVSDEKKVEAAKQKVADNTAMEAARKKFYDAIGVNLDEIPKKVEAIEDMHLEAFYKPVENAIAAHWKLYDEEYGLVNVPEQISKIERYIARLDLGFLNENERKDAGKIKAELEKALEGIDTYKATYADKCNEILTEFVTSARKGLNLAREQGIPLKMKIWSVVNKGRNGDTKDNLYPPNGFKSFPWRDWHPMGEKFKVLVSMADCYAHMITDEAICFHPEKPELMGVGTEDTVAHVILNSCCNSAQAAWPAEQALRNAGNKKVELATAMKKILGNAEILHDVRNQIAEILEQIVPTIEEATEEATEEAAESEATE